MSRRATSPRMAFNRPTIEISLWPDITGAISLDRLETSISGSRSRPSVSCEDAQGLLCAFWCRVLLDAPALSKLIDRLASVGTHLDRIAGSNPVHRHHHHGNGTSSRRC